MRALFREIMVRSPADVAVVRQIAGQMAAERDFPAQRQAEIRLMATELAQNHLDHQTREGCIRVSSLRIQDVPCVMLASVDQGPGLGNIDELLARKTGCPSTIGLGVGLASVRRLADRFAVCSQMGKKNPYQCPGSKRGRPGTIITAVSWPDYRPPQVLVDLQVDLAGIVSGRTENMPCGDGLFVDGDERFIRVALVDSPGIGTGFRMTREVGRRLQEMDLVWPPDQLLERLSFALEAGASIKIIRFDRMQQEVQCAGVGNIGLWLVVDSRIVLAAGWQPPGDLYHGGFELFRYPVRQDFACLIHSDGLQPFDREEISRLLSVDSKSGHPPRCSLVLQSAFSMNRQAQDDISICVWQWQHT